MTRATDRRPEGLGPDRRQLGPARSVRSFGQLARELPSKRAIAATDVGREEMDGGRNVGKAPALIGTIGIALVLAIGAMVGSAANAAGPPTVLLGTATSFAVLAGAGITNTGPTTITGDVGSFPTTTQTGFASVTLTGTNHAGDTVTQVAKADLVTAYNQAAASGPTIPVVADLGGQTLVAGVYNSATTLGLTGALTLSGSSSDVWIFQAGSALTTATGSSVVLIGGAQSCNVFWQIGTDTTIGTGSAFKGTIIGMNSITLTTGATIDGRALARNGAVTLDTNTITRSNCTATSPNTTPTPTPATATPTPTPGLPLITPTPIAPLATATPAPSRTAAPITSLPSTSTLGGSAPLIFGGLLLVLAGALVVGSRRTVPTER